MPKHQVGIAAMNYLRKYHYHLKTKEPNERWPGKCHWRWVSGTADVTMIESFWVTWGNHWKSFLKCGEHSRMP